jgi:hypothetical protein
MSHTQNRKLAALLQGHTTDSEKLWAGPFHIPGLFRSPQCGGGAISSFLPMHPQDYQVRTASGHHDQDCKCSLTHGRQNFSRVGGASFIRQLPTLTEAQAEKDPKFKRELNRFCCDCYQDIRLKNAAPLSTRFRCGYPRPD